MKYIFWIIFLIAIFLNNIKTEIEEVKEKEKNLDNKKEENKNKDVTQVDEDGEEITNIIMNDKNDKCNQSLFPLYGLEGNISPKEEKLKLFPNSFKTCCINKDTEIISKMWNEDLKKNIENQYLGYVYSLEYLLDYYKHTKDLAKEFLNSNSLECKNASNYINSLDYKENFLTNLKALPKNQIKEMAKIRKRSYSFLCDYESNNMIYSKNRKIAEILLNTVYVNKDFCSTLVNNTMESIYQYYAFIEKYLYNFNKLMECKLNIKNEINIKIEENKFNQIKLCFFNKDKYLLFFCEKICEDLNLFKYNKIFDGDQDSVKKIYQFLKLNKEKIFKKKFFQFFSFTSKFDDDEKYIDKYYSKTPVKNYIKKILSIEGTKELTDYKTDIIFKSGFNPYDNNFENLLDLKLIFKNDLIANLIVIFFMIFFN